jgi:RNA polymerase sigma-70 factor (ECF subfamily)
VSRVKAEGRRQKARSDGAIGTLVDNRRAFMAFLERRVGSREEAEDLLQDAFGRALARLDPALDDKSVLRWFYRVLRNAVVDHYRRKAAACRAFESFATEPDDVVPPPDGAREICACVGRLASTLKPEYADALRRIDVDGMPVKAFAEATGISPSNAGVRVFRAREALRKQVVRSCGTCAEHGCLDCTCGQAKTRSLGSRL